jgi:hypothetical protein
VSAPLEIRIDRLARRDRMVAIGFTILMWLVLAFLCAVASAVAPSGLITTVLVCAVLALGVFNTASVVAMLRRYATDRDTIYRPDIENLDRMREPRAKDRW